MRITADLLNLKLVSLRKLLAVVTGLEKVWTASKKRQDTQTQRSCLLEILDNLRTQSSSQTEFGVEFPQYL